MCTNNINNKHFEKINRKLEVDNIQKIIAGAVIYFKDRGV